MGVGRSESAREREGSDIMSTALAHTPHLGFIWTRRDLFAVPITEKAGRGKESQECAFMGKDYGH